MNREYIEADVESIVVKDRVRRDNGDLATLASSIRKLGVLAPIIIDRDNVLISGARRLEACRLAGMDKIPALRLNIHHDSMVALDIQTDENLCRQPLSSEELEQSIQLKKSRMSGESSASSGKFMSSIKKVFAGKPS